METEENAEMRKEGDLAFPSEENETSSESQPENKEADETDPVNQDKKEDEPETEPKEKPKEEEKEKIVPLHRDERFRTVLDENKRMKEQLDELSEFKTKAEPFLKERESDVKIPSWFGGDEDQYREFKADQDRLVNQAEERALKRIEERTSKQSELVKEATQYLDDSIKEIEEEGHKVDRNRLLKIVMDNELIDSKGRWNYKAGFKLLQAEEKPKDTKSLDAKKKLAASTTSEEKPEEKPKDYRTSEDFVVDKPW